MIYRGDLHIHTTLSPCGDLEMTPVQILERAKALSWDFIGITDHNDTRQAPIIATLGNQMGITVFIGAEICSSEEVHLLAYVPTEMARAALQEYLKTYRLKVANRACYFGDQVVVSTDEMILINEEDLLLTALSQDVYQVTDFVHSLGGVVVAAHVDRPSYSLISTLGFIPDDLPLDGVEYYRSSEEIDSTKWCCIQNSDAHYLKDMQPNRCEYHMSHLSFDGLKTCFRNHQIHII
ncbi:PHP domain-containing protein [Halosquirtibacter xylanolyticus]|uniref:PHP domain-containing protein n=1 Tax=Halosquirtibacter xylanolyticus TaxID=3374599 RepID=UPI003747A05A|nr:PHP domain-containing protein [Prolixibacteraceae bacterium]